MKILFWFFMIKALFCFSEGKPCPEKYRPHKTRCDTYFKCVLLPTKSHVWVPAKCERGLIFEPNLKMCVLPGEDWECNLDETMISLQNRLDENNIYGVDSFKITPDAPTKPPKSEKKINEENIKITEFIELYNNVNVNDKNLNDYDENLPIASQLENHKNTDDLNESSGDGPIENSLDDTEIPKFRENLDDMDLIENERPPPSKVDPKLKSQLQRLSQLIEGLQNTYKRKGGGSSNSNELRPDQLNAFLAHFNIKNEFDTFDPNSDGIKIESNKSEQLQNNKMNSVLSQVTNKNYQKNNTENKSKPIQNKDTKIKNVNLDPETKVILKNSGYRKHNNNNSNLRKNGYSNSQIVVNRPEGSVVFSLGNSHKQQEEKKFNNVMKHDPYDYNTEPKISEETLKTVLELSKQMISSQNFRPVLPPHLSGIYHPYMPSMYYSPVHATAYEPHNPNLMNFNYPTRGDYNNNNKNNNENVKPDPPPENIDEGYDKFSSTAYISKKDNSKKAPAPTTVIQNSVIPVHITTNSEKGIIERPQTSSISNNRYDNNYENIFNQIPEFVSNFNNQNEAASDGIHETPIQIYRISSTTTPLPTTTATTTESPYRYSSPSPPPSNHLSLLNYYTPNPHLDDSNANSIFESTDEDLYPIQSSHQFNHQLVPLRLGVQEQKPTNEHNMNLFGSKISQGSNYVMNNRDSINTYQTTKFNSPSSEFSSELHHQQPQYENHQENQFLLNMGGLDDSHINLNNGMQHINMHENYPSQSSLSSSSNYHQGNSKSNILNKQKHSQFVTNQLSHQNLDQQYSYLNGNLNNNFQSLPSISAGVFSSTTPATNILLNNNNINRYKTGGGSNTLVNLGGNFISYDIYKNKLLPALGVAAGINLGLNNNNNNQFYQPNVEIVTCTAGIRQPNSTDCTKYYVCSRKDSKILSYTCPPFTAFNSQARICDAKTYTVCNPEILFNQLSINNNQKLQIEAIKALQDAKRIREEAIRAQTFANLIRYQTEQKLNQTFQKPMIDQNAFLNPTILSSNNVLSTYAAAVEAPNGNMMDNILMTSTISTSSTTTIKPNIMNNHKHQKKRKYYCREGDKIPDQISNSNYFICYKTKDGAMHGHKMTCSNGLVFCSRTKLCTTSVNCNI